MSLSTLPQSPVLAGWQGQGVRWDEACLQKLRLTPQEKRALTAVEANPIDYTLNNSEDAAAICRIVLKVLSESNASGPSSRVSRLSGSLSQIEARQMLTADPMGVSCHYAVSKLCDIVLCLKEKKAGSAVTIGSTFYSDGNLIDEWRALLRVLHLGGSGDAFAQRGAAYCLASILMAACPSQQSGARTKEHDCSSRSAEEPLQALISWITSQLQSSSSLSLSLVTPTLIALMSCPEARIVFSNSGGIGYLSRHLRNPRAGHKSTVTVQQMYELCFCLWALTYECNGSWSIRNTFHRDNAVNSLVDLVSSAPREKVVRVALSALRTLAQCDAENSPCPAGKREITGSTYLSDMIGCGLIKYVDQMKERHWTDPDIIDDLSVLHRVLHENFKEMTRWDVYFAEVQQGQLAWGHLHSERFFKENIRQFEGPNGDFYVVKLLVALTASNDEEVQSIACYDLGEFVRHYPNGRAIARSLGAKDIVMKLVDHPNKELQRHALTAISKMMVMNWAAVN